MIPQFEFLCYLRFKRYYLACDEVKNYRNIADIIALDSGKQHVLEFEFKRSTYDLRKLELKKRKYNSGSYWKWPHKFYYVVSKELWKKNKEYLKSLKKVGIGTVMYYYEGNNEEFTFLFVIPSKLRVDNVQNYNTVVKNVLKRVTSAYIKLLMKVYGKDKKWY